MNQWPMHSMLITVIYLSFLVNDWLSFYEIIRTTVIVEEEEQMLNSPFLLCIQLQDFFAVISLALRKQ